MYDCPNCAGNLKFDIARQKLYCEYCQTEVDPYEITKEKDAEEHSDEYEVTVFTCPECGGEIMSEDNTAATFCSFCGAATILTSRISNEKRPVYIVPFQKTKEDCKEAYDKIMRRALYAPKELKNKENIEKFRGIYMPYWMYSFRKKGPVSFRGKKVYRRGDYIYTDYYALKCDVDSSYDGLTFDAASSFSDDLSAAIAPFDLREGKKFTPTFLSGFYADMDDVNEEVYRPDAKEVVIGDGCDQLLKNSVCKQYGTSRADLYEAVSPDDYEARLVMLPVWFLSYRNGDRVSYAVVNGQTGKAAAEIPVEPWKYLTGSLILAIPIFLILNLLFTFTPSKLVWLSLILDVICFFIVNGQLSGLYEKKHGEWDKGFVERRDAKAEEENPGDEKAEENKAEKKKKDSGRIVKRALWIILAILLPFIYFFIFDFWAGKLSGFFPMVVLFVVVIGVVIPLLNKLISRATVNSGRKSGKKSGKHPGKWKENISLLIRLIIGVLPTVLVLVIRPVLDIYYYLAVLVCLVCVAWSVVDIIRQHNELATRPLPQFNVRGGDANGM